MSNIRDLVVSIDFNDMDIASLARVNSAMDEVEDNARGIIADVEGATAEINHFGHAGAHDAHLVSNALDEVGDEARQATADIAAMDAVSHTAMSNMEHGANGAGHAMEQMQHGLSPQQIIGWGITWTLVFAAAVAAAAPLLAAVMGIAASLVAGTVGVAAFGAVAMGSLKGVFDAASKVNTIQKKIDNATTAKERTKAQKELAGVYSKMSKEQRGALQELQDFKKFWGGFVKEFNKPVFKMFAQGLQMTEGILKRLKPTIKSVGDVTNKLFSEFNAAMNGGAFKGFFDWIEGNAGRSLYNFSHIAGNTLNGFFSLLQAFQPFGVQMENGLLSLTQRFADWSAKLSTSDGFKKFMDYAQTNGPILMTFLGNTWDLLVDIVKAAAPLGTEVLTDLGALTGGAQNLVPKLSDILNGFTSVLEYVRDNWGTVSTVVLGAAAAVATFKLYLGGLKIIEGITTLINGFRVATGMATAAELGLNAALLANPITWVVILIAALIAAGVMLWKNWDTVKEKMSSVWDSIESGASKMVNGIISGLNWLIKKINLIPGINIPIIPKVYWGKGAKTEHYGGANNTGAVSGAYLATHSHATGLFDVPYDGYIGQLHKNETVLTAMQSNVLKSMGILSKTGSRPKVNQTAGPISKGNSYSSNQTTIAPHIEIKIDGTSGDAKEIGKQAATAARNEMEKLFEQLGLSFA